MSVANTHFTPPPTCVCVGGRVLKVVIIRGFQVILVAVLINARCMRTNVTVPSLCVCVCVCVFVWCVQGSTAVLVFATR